VRGEIKAYCRDFVEAARARTCERMDGTTPTIGFFEKYLTAWVLLCIAVGIALGELAGSGMQASPTWRSTR
jgi:hypothetical protein